MNEEERLKSRWGKDIRIYDELDPNFIAVNEDPLPIPIIITAKAQKRQSKLLEKALLNPVSAPKYAYKIGLTNVTTTRMRKNRLPIPQYIKDIVIQDRGTLCEHCREKRFDQWHHKNNNPFDNNPLNLELLCYHCHKITHKKYGNDFLE
jgi:hypothetical protein